MIKNKKNFTLIELMGAMVIAVVLIAMLTRIFGSSTQLMRRKFQTIDSFSTARTALNMLSRDLTNLYHKSNTSAGIATDMTFTNSEITVYTYGAVSRPDSSDEVLIAETISIPQKVTYTVTGTTLTKETYEYDYSNSDYNGSPTSALSGTVLTNVKSFTVQAYKKDGSGGYITESSFTDGTIPYLVIFSFELEPSSGSAKDKENNVRKFTKTIITEPKV